MAGGWLIKLVVSDRMRHQSSWVRKVINFLRPIAFPYKERLLRHFVPTEGARRARVGGVEMELDLSEMIQSQIYLGVFEQRETRAVRSRLKQGAVLVDVGANVGYYCAVASELVGATGRIFAVEPSPYAYHKLEVLVSCNSLNHCRILQAGLSDKAGQLTLWIPPISTRNHNPSLVQWENDWTPLEIRVRTLDDCLDEWAVTVVDLLKIDVEGHELRVLEGAKRALEAGRIRAILCEFNDEALRRTGSDPITLWRYLERFGFDDIYHPGRVPHFAPGCIENRMLVVRTPR